MKSILTLFSVFTVSACTLCCAYAYEPSYELSNSTFSFQCTIPDHGAVCDVQELVIEETTKQVEVNPVLWNKTTNDIVILDFRSPTNATSVEKIKLVNQNDAQESIAECYQAISCLVVNDGENELEIREREYVSQPTLFVSTKFNF